MISGVTSSIARPVVTPITGTWSAPGTALFIDFANRVAEQSGQAVDFWSLLSTTRSSSTLAEKSGSSYVEFASNVPALTDKGLTVEPTAVQYALNNYDYGAQVDGVLGGAGVLPEHLTYGDASGTYTFTIARTTNLGLPMLQVRVLGTNGTGSTQFPYLSIASTAAGTAALAEDWTGRVWARIAAGAVPANGGALRFSALRELNAGSSFLADNFTDIGNATLTRLTLSQALTQATVSRMDSQIYVRVPASEACDVTFECGMWELFKSATPPQTPVITTAAAGATATRAADDISFDLPGGTHDLVFTFDDGSTQTISGQSGTYTIPTNLNRPIIRSLVTS